MSLVWFTWARRRQCSCAAVVAARVPVAKGKAAATAPDATDTAETGGGGGVDLGFVLQALTTRRLQLWQPETTGRELEPTTRM